MVLYMVVIYSLSSAPLEEQGPQVNSAHHIVGAAMAAATSDPMTAEKLTPTVEHVGLYEGLGALALVSWSSMRMLPLEGRWRRLACVAWKWSVPLAIGVAFCYGMFDEWHQGWVPGRTLSMDDVKWDVIGGAAGAVAALGMRSMFVRDGLLRRWALGS